MNITSSKKLFPEGFDGLQINSYEFESSEIIAVSLEKGKIFPDHTSTRNAGIVLIQGSINFITKESTNTFSAPYFFTFPKDLVHSVTANDDSRFIILR